MRRYSCTVLRIGALWCLWAAMAPQGRCNLQTNNVVIVLDASGSMGSKMSGTSVQKMDAAKSALIEVLKQVPSDTQIGVLVFSAKNSDEDWIYPLGPRDDKELVRAIQSPQPGYKTPLGDYIKKGADALLQAREKQYGYGAYRLLIVTDGEADDQDLVDLYVPEVMARGLVIDAIGVDMDTAHTLATQVHSYRSADDPESLKRAVADAFAEVADGDTDAAGEDAFSSIAPLPDELAAAMLKAVSGLANQPIGLSPSASQSSSEDPQNSRVPSSGDMATPPAQKAGALPLVIVGVIAFTVLRSALRGSRRRRR